MNDQENRKRRRVAGVYMYEFEVSGALLTRISKIMRPTGTWAFLASLALLATVVSAHHICGHSYKPPPPRCDYNPNEHIQRAISSGAEVVTYGEPCFCKESIPYSIQVPKHSIEQPKVEKLGTYGYALDVPSITKHERCFQLPTRIQTPVIEHHRQSDHLRGRTYGVMVQHQEHRPGPKRFNFDYALQKPVRVEKSFSAPSMSILIQKQEEQIHPRFSPLPIEVQTPVRPSTETERIRLNPLSAKVDKVLVPACVIDGCPDCNDIRPKIHGHRYIHSPSPLPPTYSSC